MLGVREGGGVWQYLCDHGQSQEEEEDGDRGGSQHSRARVETELGKLVN